MFELKFLAVLRMAEVTDWAKESPALQDGDEFRYSYTGQSGHAETTYEGWKGSFRSDAGNSGLHDQCVKFPS